MNDFKSAIVNSIRRMISGVNERLVFILAGNSIFSVVSKKTDTSLTFLVKQAYERAYKVRMGNRMVWRGRVNKKKPIPGLWWVCAEIGSGHNFKYLGCIRSQQVEMGDENATDYQFWPKRGGSAAFPIDCKQERAFRFVLERTVAGDSAPDLMEFWHEGRCCRCSRTLSDPVSVDRGIGPDCWKIMNPKPVTVAHTAP